MVLIRVRYDAYNRQFKLLDRELASMLEDGETYWIAVGGWPPDLDSEGLSEIRETDLAHA